MKPVRLSRRTLLRGVGTAIALPVLDAMLDNHGLLLGTANAATPQVPIKLFSIFFACGTNMGRQLGDSTVDVWTPPSGSGTSYTLSPALQPLAPVKGDVNVLGGLENTAVRLQYIQEGTSPGCNHMLGSGTIFNGMPPNGQYNVSGPSYDQVAVQKLGLATATRYPSISGAQPTGGPQDSSPSDILSWSGPNAPIEPYSDPVKLFQTMFGSAGTTVSSAADDKSVLDYVSADVTRLQTRLGKRDQMLLEQHLDSIRGVEHAMSTSVNCATPTPPNPTFPDKQLLDYDKRTPMLIQLLTMALQCDITRVVTLCLGPAGDHGTYTWLGQTMDHHSLSHEPGTMNDQIIAYTQWNVQQFVNVVQALKAASDGTGTLLDNSVVCMTSEVGDGDLHSFDNLPVLTAGGAGGRVVNGRYIKYPWTTGTGTPINNLWITILQAMGANVTSFGVDGTGPLPGFLT